MALNYCLVGRWFKFEFNNSNKSIVVDRFHILENDFLTIYEYLNNQQEIDYINSSANLESIIIDETILDDLDIEEIGSALESQLKFNEIKETKILSTPLFKRLKRKNN